MRLVFGIELGQFVEAQLARVVVLGAVLIFGKDAAAELRGGPFLVFEIILIGLEHGGIDLETFLLERLGDFDGGIAVGHGTAGAAIYRGIAAHTEHGDFRALGKRQGVIAVLQQRVGLLRLVHGRLLKALVRLLGGFVFGFVRPAIAAVGGLVRYGLLVPTNASRDVRYVSMIVPAMMATARSNAPTAVIPRHRPVRSCISYSLSFSISAGIFDGENPVPPVCLNIRRRISVAS